MPRWPHEVLGLQVTPEEARRLLSTFQVAEARYLELKQVEEQTRFMKD